MFRLLKSFSLFCTSVLLFCLAFHAESQVVRTGYTSLVASNSGKCLDTKGELTVSGTVIVQESCNPAAATQQWTVTPYQGSFRILQQQTADCLAIPGSSTKNSVQLAIQPCSGISGELWSFTAIGTHFQVINKGSGQCASVGAALLSDGANINQWPCYNGPEMLWSFSSQLISNSMPAVVQADHSGQCLSVSGASSTVGAAVIQNPCSGVTSGQWLVVPSGSSYQLVAGNSNLCMAVSGNSTAPNANIIQSTCNGAASTLWKLNSVGGAYQLIGQNSGLCASVSAASQTAAAQVIQTTCSAATNELWSLSKASLPSTWTPVITLAVDPVAVANLPNGQLVMWSSNSQVGYQGDIGDSPNGSTYTGLFDPVAGVSTETLVTNTGDDMFCPGTSNLFNGEILVNGGDSSPKTSLYNPSTGLWTSDALMNIPRGYQANTVLTNGSVLTFGGSWSGGLGGKTAEVWTAGKGWQVLTNVPEDTIIGNDPAGTYRGDNHLWMFDAPNGEVFHAGPSAQMHWITTSGLGTITSAGNRSTDPYSINGNAVLYDVGMIMKAGGAPGYQDVNAETSAFMININNGTAGVTVTPIAPMAYPRAFSNGTVLPNGQVVIVGGQTYALPFSDDTAILIPEIWDPLTQVFRQLNPMQTPRVYHSTGILLQDGRVFSGGGGLCGLCTENHLNTEILTPPYLLNADGTAAARPAITAAPSTTKLGNSLTVTTGSPVVSFVFMRLSSVTHTVNNDQRRVPLQISSTSGSTYTLNVPSNPGILLPGYYWLFAMNDQGVPSEGAVIQVM